jgi:two-component system sensor histidine kinase/response regulator
MENKIEVLVVEDSPTQAMLLKHMLKQHSFEASIAKNGAEALEAVKKRKPTLVISDVMMPVMDGYEMCHAIKNDETIKHIPVILLTVLSDPKDVIRGLEARADAFLTKPCNEEQLLAKINAILANPADNKSEDPLEVTLSDKRYVITSNRQQILNLLLFTYENTVQKNRELTEVQNELKKLNEQLEEKVEERTGELKTEISERKRIEESLKKANEKLKEFDRLKSDFLSTVSHELRTPLSIISEGISICLGEIAGKITNEQKEIMINIEESIEYLKRLIRDLLDLSKIEANKIDLYRTSFDLCEVVRKIRNDFEPKTGESQITLQIDQPDKPIKLFADKDKIKQIFNNLISNAIRFTDPGGNITIAVKELKNCIECRVSDTGIGIAKKDIPKLFSKFEQIGRAKTSGYKGTGLGLPITKGLIEKHEGKITVESEIGKGTSFIFTLKKVPFPKILIIDDEQIMIDLVKEILSKSDFQCVQANDGTAAIEKAQNENPSLILLDMVMPGMNGYEIIGRLKQDKRTHQIPILIMSAFSVNQKQLEKYNNHMEIPSMQKPFNPEALKTKVYNMLAE